MARRSQPDDDVPHLPRGRGFKLSSAGIVKIVVTATFLIAVLVFRKPCGNATARFVNNFEQRDAGHYVPLKGLTDDEVKAAIEKARAEAAARVGSGSGSNQP